MSAESTEHAHSDEIIDDQDESATDADASPKDPLPAASRRKATLLPITWRNSLISLTSTATLTSKSVTAARTFPSLPRTKPMVSTASSAKTAKSWKPFRN
ncbi:hypothetical protein AHiyo4_00390 [Arthrobacter sp. Hiyo4]|nr:hypothetical protein AHiyo4_00390 [Arthrobacter sp. Hiyo4]